MNGIDRALCNPFAALALIACCSACSDSSDGSRTTSRGGVEGNGGFGPMVDGGAGGDAGAATGGGGDAGDSGTSSGGASGSTSEPGVCDIVAPTACPDPRPVYADVEPIFKERCVVCHGMSAGPWPLNTYAHVATWRDTIRAALLTCQMPPVDSGLVIPDDESLQILTWIRCGMPF